MAEKARPASAEMLALRDLLRTLRASTTLSQGDVARELGVAQPTVSRWETTTEKTLTSPSPDQLWQLAQLYGAVGRESAEMLRLRAAIESARNPSMQSVLRDPRPIQERVAELEENAHEICSYRPDVVPGVIQTRPYIRAIFEGSGQSGEALDALVDQRYARRSLLSSPGREWILITTMGALLWSIGGPGVMFEQLRFLADDVSWPNVRLGVIGPGAQVSTTAMHGFDIFRGPSTEAMAGLLTGTAMVPSDSEGFAAMDRHWQVALDAASFGREARELIDWAAEVHERNL